jgi:hypothetical protein
LLCRWTTSPSFIPVMGESVATRPMKATLSPFPRIAFPDPFGRPLGFHADKPGSPLRIDRCPYRHRPRLDRSPMTVRRCPFEPRRSSAGAEMPSPSQHTESKARIST